MRVPSIGAASTRGSQSRPHVLVAESNELLRRSIVDALSVDGFAVSEARNGDEFIALVRNSIDGRRAAFDLLVVDAELPCISGLDALGALANYLDLRRAVIISTRADATLRDRAEALGTRGVLDAPLDIDDLRTVAMALAAR